MEYWLGEGSSKEAFHPQASERAVSCTVWRQQPQAQPKARAGEMAQWGKCWRPSL